MIDTPKLGALTRASAQGSGEAQLRKIMRSNSMPLRVSTQHGSLPQRRLTDPQDRLIHSDDEVFRRSVPETARRAIVSSTTIDTIDKKSNFIRYVTSSDEDEAGDSGSDGDQDADQRPSLSKNLASAASLLTLDSGFAEPMFHVANGRASRWTGGGPPRHWEVAPDSPGADYGRPHHFESAPDPQAIGDWKAYDSLMDVMKIPDRDDGGVIIGNIHSGPKTPKTRRRSFDSGDSDNCSAGSGMWAHVVWPWVSPQKPWISPKKPRCNGRSDAGSETMPSTPRTKVQTRASQFFRRCMVTGAAALALATLCGATLYLTNKAWFLQMFLGEEDGNEEQKFAQHRRIVTLRGQVREGHLAHQN